jgi:hypothetical protein
MTPDPPTPSIVWHRGSNMVRVPLVAGKRYDIRIEMECQESKAVHAVLFWGSENDLLIAVVPRQSLYSRS